MDEILERLYELKGAWQRSREDFSDEAVDELLHLALKLGAQRDASRAFCLFVMHEFIEEKATRFLDERK